MECPQREGLVRVEELEGRIVPSAVTSTNWSGYSVETARGAVTSVTGSWKMPSVSGSGTAYSSTWVGIDGSNSRTVEQIGTEGDISNGAPVYFAWFELYPRYPVEIMTVNPGDSITASVSDLSTSGNKSSFFLQITDTPVSGPAHSFSTTKTISGAHLSSAEWIEEAPSSGSGVLPLADFGSVAFTGAHATISGAKGPIDNAWQNTQLYQINMVSPRTGATEDTTSGLTDSGPTSSFTVSYAATNAALLAPRHHYYWAPNQVAPAPALASAALAVSPSLAVFAPGLTTSGQLATPALLPTSASLNSSITVAVPSFSPNGVCLVGGTQDAANPGAKDVDLPVLPDDPAMNELGANSNAGAAHRRMFAPQPATASLPEATAFVPLAQDACFIEFRRESPALESVARALVSQPEQEAASAEAAAAVLFSLALGLHPDTSAEESAARRRSQRLLW